MIPPLLSYAPFLFCFFCPLRFPFFKFFFTLRAFKKFLGFREVSTGQGLLSRAGGIFVPGCFFRHISPFSVFSFQGTMPLCGVKCFLSSITVPLCAAAAVSVPPVYPAGYGQPAAVNCPVRFSALPVPSYLSSCLFHWPLPLLPTSHSPPTGH